MFLTDEELADLTHRRRRPETRANKGFPRLPYWFDPSTAHQEKTSIIRHLDSKRCLVADKTRHA